MRNDSRKQHEDPRQPAGKFADQSAGEEIIRQRRRGVSVRAYLEPNDDDCGPDWIDHDCDAAQTGGQPEARVAGDSPGVDLVCDALESQGELLLRVIALEGTRRLWDGVLNAQDVADIQRTTQALTDHAGLAFARVEQQLADIVVRERRLWLERKQARAQHDPTDFLAGVLDSPAFAQTDCRRDWLVKGLLVRNEPVLIGGPKKSLKTSLIVDLALSLGSGTLLLNRFEVPRRVRTLVLSGESGAATLQETARRVCQSKQLALRDCDVRWGFRLPNLSRPEDLDRLGDYVRREQVQVVVIDPLYLCLLQAGVPLATSNLFQTGPLLLQVATVCQEAGATPVLVHHARKQTVLGKATASYAALDLDDLAFSGFAEFARQWVLLSRRAAYEPGSGTHELWLNVGGSAGQGGLWGVNVEEGALQDDFSGRGWKVLVLNRKDVDALVANDRQDQRRVKQEAELLETRKCIVLALRHQSAGETMTGLAALPGVKKRLVHQALLDLERDGRVQPTKLQKPKGKHLGEYDGWKLTPQGRVLVDHSEQSEPGVPVRHILRRAKHEAQQRQVDQQAARQVERQVDPQVQPAPVDQPGATLGAAADLSR